MPDTDGGFTYLRPGAQRSEQVELQTKGWKAGVPVEPELESAPEPEPETQEDLEDDYPEDGTIPEVKAWIGDDLDRAQVALDREGERDTPRVTLLDYLQDMLTEPDTEA